VLVAEDDEMIRLAVTGLLQAEFQVDAVPDAETAMRLARETDYDLIVLDIGLPGESGVEALRALRGLPVYAERPVIALTGYVMPDDRRRFLEEGFTAYVPKPFEPDRFLEQVRILASS
jgi:CheY-like chemotaxis protein